MKSSAAALLLFAVIARCTLAADPAEPRVDFNRDIRPILSKNCFACHGQDPGSRVGKFRLDRRDFATERRKISGLECTTRIVLSAILPNTNASPATNTAIVETANPGLLETTTKLARPKTMLVPSAIRAEVRSVNQPASGAHTDCAMM